LDLAIVGKELLAFTDPAPLLHSLPPHVGGRRQGTTFKDVPQILFRKRPLFLLVYPVIPFRHVILSDSKGLVLLC
jgi:hypothetical protein